MFTKYISLAISVWCCVLSTDCLQLLKTECYRSTCYYLYETNDFKTWNRSSETCSNKGQNMASIESEEVQKVIQILVQDIPNNKPRQIWIGGRRSTDTRWIYMNETEFDKTECLWLEVLHQQYGRRPAFQPSIRRVANRRKDIDSIENAHRSVSKIIPMINKLSYEDRLKTAMVISVYYRQQRGSCNSMSGESNFGGKCYKKTMYNGQEPTRIDWYSGQTYCSQMYVHGEIAYSYLDDKSSTDSVRSLVDGSSDCIHLWLGVRKKLWFWETGLISDTTKQLINYFNWFKQQDTEHTVQDCIYIDVYNENKWFTQRCTNPPRKFVICMNETSTASTPKNEHTTYTISSSTTSRSTTSSSTTSTSTTSSTARSSEQNPTSTAIDNDLTSNTSTSNETNRNNEFNPIYIIPVVVVLLGVIIGLPIFLVIKKKRQTAKDRSSINDGFQDPPQKPSPKDDPECVNIDLSGNEDDAVPDPYDTTGTTPTGNTDVRHKETPSGDLYALSSKQLYESDDDKKKDVINPEELYAKPNKKRNQKPNMNGLSEDKQYMESTHNVDTLKPSGDKKSPGIKRTKHFESESGDVYATVIK
ncbi:hypothetical protein LSH36_1641g00047 [Paralvinella palmiformis]|uniref:C-type lectin domain-containing protein n=1 Tax=Paralvinella palmiformis TaxID=53620 RepID=A0AAD9MNC6_9ANNE|nr:hypothetical protein LSH36_1641g00047 [Paralvinella palmiformis]